MDEWVSLVYMNKICYFIPTTSRTLFCQILLVNILQKESEALRQKILQVKKNWEITIKKKFLLKLNQHY